MSKTNSPNRDLLFGGWTAVKSAMISSLLLILLHILQSSIASIRIIGPDAIWFSSADLLNVLITTAIAFIIVNLLSVVPAFLGGAFLAWQNRSEKLSKTTLPRKGAMLGSATGAIAGILLAAVVLIPVYWIDKNAHGGYGFELWQEIRRLGFYALEIIVIACVAGAWTEKKIKAQLRAS